MDVWGTVPGLTRRARRGVPHRAGSAGWFDSAQSRAARRDEVEAECGLRRRGGLGSLIVNRHATGEQAKRREGRRTSGLTRAFSLRVPRY